MDDRKIRSYIVDVDFRNHPLLLNVFYGVHPNEEPQQCTCSYGSCPRKGRCCECVSYHLSAGELPGCFFPAAAERTYDRSYAHFARLVASGKVG